MKAVGDGVPQKQNLVSASSSTINHSLVAGLFVPSHKSKEEALIYICDPEQTDLSEILAQISLERVQTAIVQVDLARHFALMGLHSIANALTSSDISTQNPLSNIDKREIAALRLSSDNREREFEISFLLPRQTTYFEGQNIRQARFAMTCPVDLYERLVGNDSLERTLRSIVEVANEHEWEEASNEVEATLTTPLGFTLKLAYLPQ